MDMLWSHGGQIKRKRKKEIVVASSGCVTEDEFKRATVMVSVEVVGPERVFVEGYTMKNKDCVRLVTFSEVQSIV